MKRRLLAVVAAVMMAGTATCGVDVTPGTKPVVPAVTQAERDELKAKMDVMVAPERAVTSKMLEDVVDLDYHVNRYPEPQAMGFSSGSSIYDMPGYQMALAKCGEVLAQALAGKKAEARDSCVVTLLTMPGALHALDQVKVRPWAPGVLAGMSQEEVTNVLDRCWLRARSPELLPVLLKMYDALPDEKVSAGKYGASQLRDTLLRRAYELSPEQVRGRVLAAIKDPGQRFYENWTTSLMVLPDKELPEMDEVFAVMMNASQRDAGRVETGIWSKLVSRYGTAKLEADVKQLFDFSVERGACTLQESMLAYFLRVDPAYGRQALATSLESQDSRCRRVLLSNVAALIWTPELEQAAMETLDDGDADVAMNAARVLEVRGSAAAKEALMGALAKVHVPRGSTAYNDPIAARQNALVLALLGGQGWVLTAAEVAKVQAMATDPDLVQLCKTRAEQTVVTVTFSTKESGESTVRLGSESYTTVMELVLLAGQSYQTLAEVERKVSLYPAGMKFRVEGEEADVARREFVAWAREKKLVVE